MTNRIRVLFLALLAFALVPQDVAAQRPGFGMLYYNGEAVRTIVPPSRTPMLGVIHSTGLRMGSMGSSALRALLRVTRNTMAGTGRSTP